MISDEKISICKIREYTLTDKSETGQIREISFFNVIEF